MVITAIYLPMGIISVGSPGPSIFSAKTLIIIVLSSNSEDDGHIVASAGETSSSYSQTLPLHLLSLAEMVVTELRELASDEILTV